MVAGQQHVGWTSFARKIAHYRCLERGVTDKSIKEIQPSVALRLSRVTWRGENEGHPAADVMLEEDQQTKCAKPPAVPGPIPK